MRPIATVPRAVVNETFSGVREYGQVLRGVSAEADREIVVQRREGQGWPGIVLP